MEFARPHLLYALLLVPLFAVVLLRAARRRREQLELFAGAELAESLAPGSSWRRGALKGVLALSGLALIIFALAGPRFGSKLVKVEREGVDLVIALDTSLSMLAEDMKPNRLERAKMEIIDLIRGLEGDRVGILVFAGSAVPLCPLTVDYDAALMLASSIDVGMVSTPGTSIGRAIEKCTDLFERSTRKDRAIILVTDGESHDDDPVREAKKAADKGIKIYTIGIGNPSGELIPLRATDGTVEGYKKDSKGRTVMTRLDENTLRAVASESGGKYLPATREGLELKILYDEISGMERKKIKGEFIEKKEERFAFFLAGAFFLLGVEMLISSRATKRNQRGRRVLHTGALILVFLLLLPGALWARGVDRSRLKAANEYFHAGEYDKALALYREALGDSTHLPENYRGVLYNQANTLHMMGRMNEALEKYRMSLGGEDTLLSGSALYNRGNTILKMGKAKEAVSSYVEALRFIPDDPDVLYNLELALRRMKEQEEQKHEGGKKQEKKQHQDEQGNRGDERRGMGSERNEEEKQQKREQEDERGAGKQEEKQGREQSAVQSADSTSTMPQPRDSTAMGEAKELLLSREEALNLLRALEEAERELQREKRKAAFQRIPKKGKDW